MRFTETHEWVEANSEGLATVGVTQHAQRELGDIVYIELPQVGKVVKVGQEAAVLESTKAAADVYSPLSGTIVEVNTRLQSASELVNQSPENEGWIFKIKMDNPDQVLKLLDSTAYYAMLEG